MKTKEIEAIEQQEAQTGFGGQEKIDSKPLRRGTNRMPKKKKRKK